MGPKRPIDRQPNEKVMLRALKPDLFFATGPSVLDRISALLNHFLNMRHLQGLDTGDNEACIDAVVVLMTRDDETFAYLDSKATPPPEQWWKDYGPTAIRAMAIAALEHYIDAGGWAGPVPSGQPNA